MKHVLFTFVLSFLFITCIAQKNAIDTLAYKKTIHDQASAMGQSMLKKDFNSFAKYVHPKIMEMMGGKQKLIDEMKKSMEEIEASEVFFLNIAFGESSEIISYNKELQSTILQTIGMKVPNGRMVTKSTLIVVSADNGKNWYFIDAAGNNIQAMKKDLPNLSPDLVIPPRQQPVFYND